MHKRIICRLQIVVFLLYMLVCICGSQTDAKPTGLLEPTDVPKHPVSAMTAITNKTWLLKPNGYEVRLHIEHLVQCYSGFDITIQCNDTIVSRDEVYFWNKNKNKMLHLILGNSTTDCTVIVQDNRKYNNQCLMELKLYKEGHCLRGNMKTTKTIELKPIDTGEVSTNHTEYYTSPNSTDFSNTTHQGMTERNNTASTAPEVTGGNNTASTAPEVTGGNNTASTAPKVYLPTSGAATNTLYMGPMAICCFLLSYSVY